MPKKTKAPYLPIDRSFFEGEIWTGSVFTAGMAWIDLNYLAAFEDTTEFYGGKVVTVKRGQLITSTGKLAKRWKWTKNHVKAHLATLEGAALITTKGTTKGTTITVENYPNFDFTPTTDHTTDHTTDRTTHHTTDHTTKELSSYYMKNQELRIKNKETESDSNIIREFVDPKTGEERIVIKP